MVAYWMHEALKQNAIGPQQGSSLDGKLATEEPAEILPARDAVTNYLAEIGRRGGIKGGKARANSLSKKRKKQIAQLAAQARWGNNRNGSKN